MAKSQDEKHQKILRQLLQEPSNKQCMDCKQKGPVYANLTHGTFVCTTCSGLHREFSHRVKSISMATFTPDEIIKMQEGGNDKAKQHWRATWNPEDFPVPDSNDQEGLRRFIRTTYVDKRWIAGGGGSASAGSGKEKRAPARTASTASHSHTQKAKTSPRGHADPELPAPEPLSNILGSNIPRLSVGDERQVSSRKDSHKNVSPKGPSTANGSSANGNGASSSSSGNLIDLLGPDFPMSSPSQPVNPMMGAYMTPMAPANPNPFGGGGAAPPAANGGGLSSLNPSLFAAPAPAPAPAPAYGGGFNPFAGAAPAPMAPAPIAQPQPAVNPLAQQQATPQQIVAVLQSMGITNPQVQMNVVQQMQFMSAPQQQQFIAQLRLQLLQQMGGGAPNMFGAPAVPPPTAQADPFAGLGSLGGARTQPPAQGPFF